MCLLRLLTLEKVLGHLWDRHLKRSDDGAVSVDERSVEKIDDDPLSRFALISP